MELIRHMPARDFAQLSDVENEKPTPYGVGLKATNSVLSAGHAQHGQPENAWSSWRSTWSERCRSRSVRWQLGGLEQRYTDVPPAELFVPTLSAFAAAKTVTWHDRRASRDLWDLWALSGIGAIDSAAGALYRRHGPTNRFPSSQLFDRAPGEDDWNTQLAGQTWLVITAETALAAVRDA